MARALKIAVLHYQPANEPVDPVVLQVQKALDSQGSRTTLVDVDDGAAVRSAELHSARWPALRSGGIWCEGRTK